MIEEAKIKISTELDAKGLNELRQAMRGSIQELTAISKTLNKNSQDFKILQSAIADMTTTVKMSDADLKKYAQSLTQTGTEADKSEIKLGKFGKQVATTTKGLGKIAGGIVSLAGSFATLTPLVTDSDSKFGKIADTIQTVGISVIGVGQAMNQLRFILPSLTSEVLIAAGAWGAIAAAIGYAGRKLTEYENSLKSSSAIKFDATGRAYLNQFQTDDASQTIKKEETFAEKTIREFNERMQLKLENTQYAPGNDYGKKVFESMKPDKIPKRATQKEKEDLDEIEQLQKQIAGLEEDKLGYITKYGEQSNIVLDTLKKIAELQERIASLTGQTIKFSTEGVKVPERRIGGLTPEQIRQSGFSAESFIINSNAESQTKEKSQGLLEDSQQIYGNISSMMSVLNVGADTFVGKMLSGFSDVAIIIDSIKSINSIFNFFKLPFLAEGGTALAGMPHIVGERGMELFVPNTTGRVFNNADTMRMLNMSNHNKNVNNVYVSASITKDGFKAKIEEYNKAKNYIKL